MRAVVIDDSPTMRAMIKASLSKLGWTIVGEGENGVEGLEMARSLRPDLMTLDIIMPEMDGIECYRHLRQLESPPKVLLVSVLAAEPRVIQAYEQEIVTSHFLKKPYTDKEFKDKIEHVMATGAMPFPVLKSLEEAPPPTDTPSAPVAGPQTPPIPLN